MRKVILSWALLLGMVGVFQPAKADLRGGVCLLSMHFTFNPPLKFSQAPVGNQIWTLNYNSVAPANCVVSPTQIGDPLVRTTEGNVAGHEGTASGLLWTCEAFLGVAAWDQTFNPSLPVPISNANLLLSVGQGATIVISSNISSFQGIIHIDSVPPVAQCNGAGLDAFNATGVMEFHDPEVPQ